MFQAEQDQVRRIMTKIREGAMHRTFKVATSIYTVEPLLSLGWCTANIFFTIGLTAYL